MNKKLLFCLFVSLSLSTLPFSWSENPLTIAYEWMLKKIKKESGEIDNTVQNPSRERFHKAIYKEFTEGIGENVINRKYNNSTLSQFRIGLKIAKAGCLTQKNKARLSENDLYRLEILSLGTLESQLSGTIDAIYDLVEEYRYNLKYNCNKIVGYGITKYPTKNLALEKFENFKRSGDFNELENALEMIQFAQALKPESFDKNINENCKKLLTLRAIYPLQDFSMYCEQFDQFDQFLN